MKIASTSAAVAWACCACCAQAPSSSAFAPPQLAALRPSSTMQQSASTFAASTTSSALYSSAGGSSNGGGGGSSRRTVLQTSASSLLVGAASSLLSSPQAAYADAAAIQDSLDVNNFLRTGVDAGGPMGVSSQAGKSRPQTGVVLRDGSDVSQDSRTGGVLAEILTGTKENPKAFVVSFSSPWKLETGPVFDVETRDGKTGDGAFLAVTKSTGGTPLSNLPSAFFLERLFDPTGRFSFYGPPTDVKVKKDATEGDRRYIELSFSNLSQSTNAEIPRKGLLVATVPQGSDDAIMLVGSANASRWKKGSEKTVRETVESFRATPAPKTSLKLRAKDRGAPSLF